MFTDRELRGVGFNIDADFYIVKLQDAIEEAQLERVQLTVKLTIDPEEEITYQLQLCISITFQKNIPNSSIC